MGGDIGWKAWPLIPNQVIPAYFLCEASLTPEVVYEYEYEE